MQRETFEAYRQNTDYWYSAYMLIESPWSILVGIYLLEIMGYE